MFVNPPSCRSCNLRKPANPFRHVAAMLSRDRMPAPLSHPAMASFLTVKEAAQLTGKSPSSIRRIVYPIIHDNAHSDRGHIQPTIEEVMQLRVKGENFAWHVSEELLRR